MFKCEYCGKTTELSQSKPTENTQKAVKNEADLSKRHYYVLPNGIQAKDVSGHFMGNVCIALNYLMRAGKKPGASYQDDIQKAIDHLNFELERIKDEKAL